jgi:hypothetical protein
MFGSHSSLNLEIVSNTPEVFYNDPKSNSFGVELVLRWTSPNDPPQDQFAVSVEILYERGEIVDNQNILEKLYAPVLVSLDKPEAFRFRISQVSRNHLNRRFKLRFTLHDGSNATSLVRVETTSLHVFSKMASKRSRGKKTSGDESAKRACLADKKWIASAAALLKDIAWTRVGYEMGFGASGEEILDKSRPIYRCVSCQAMSSAVGVNPPKNSHKAGCALRALMQTQHKGCEPPPASFTAPSTHIDRPGADPLDSLLDMDFGQEQLPTTQGMPMTTAARLRQSPVHR